jgi:hypothetical protein
MNFKHDESRLCCLGEAGITTAVLQKVTNTIQAAMTCGQSWCRVIIMKQNLHYRIHETESRADPFTCDRSHTTKLRNRFTMVPFQNMECELYPTVYRLLDYLIENGIYYTVTTLENPTYSFCNWAELVAVFVPEDTTLRDKPGMLYNMWNNIHTTKCLDLELSSQWGKTIRNALVAGQPTAIIMLMWEGSDFNIEEKTDSLVPTRLSEFDCIFPRDCYTRQIIERRKCVLDKKFVNLVRWAAETGYEWTLLFGLRPRWAYFTIMLEPQSIDDVLHYN